MRFCDWGLYLLGWYGEERAALYGRQRKKRHDLVLALGRAARGGGEDPGGRQGEPGAQRRQNKEEPASLPALRSWRRWWNAEGLCGLGGNGPGDRWHATEWSFKEGG